MKEYLPAIDQLIEHYSNQEPLSQLALGLEGCPLCKIGRLPESSVPTDDNCPSCPWVVLEGGNCVSKDYYEDSVDERLKRLKRWHKLIEEGV